MYSSLTGGYTSRPMKLNDFLGLFYIVMIFLGISFTVFICEKIGFRVKQWLQGEKNFKARLPSVSVHNERLILPVRTIVPSQFDLLEIDRLTEEINHFLHPAYDDARSILHELLYINKQ